MGDAPAHLSRVSAVAGLDCAAEFSGVNMGAFALMDNHFHIVVQAPFREGSIRIATLQA